MRKVKFYLYALMAFAGMSLVTSCGTEEEDPATPLPAAEGTVKISFAPNPNFQIAGNGDATVSAASGDELTVSVIMEKSPAGTKPQTLRVWEATAPNTRGTLLDKIDLKKSLDIQKKTFEYSVKQTSGTVYLYFEVDETQDKFSRRLLTVNIGAAGSINTFPTITLGAQGNAAPSRMASATGDVYTACELEENIEFVDIVYLVTPRETPAVPRLMSNTQISSFGFNNTFTVGSSNPVCGGSTVNAAGGLDTHFELLPTTVNWANITDEASLLAATTGVSTSDPQSIALELTGNPRLYGFVNEKGKKGIIRVNSIGTEGGSFSTGTLKIDVKVQR